MLDWVIYNAEVLDGSGAPAFHGGIAVEDGKIAEIGKVENLPAEHRLDAAGKTLTPGFLDIHRHGDAALFDKEYGKAELMQGLTTVINGNCGMSAAPITPGHGTEIRSYLAPVLGSLPEETFFSMADYFQRAAQILLPLNVGMLVGGGVLRADVAGFRDGKLNREDLWCLHTLLSHALGDGALGVSLGLGYAPECFYSTGQLIEALAPLRDSGTVITVHMRQEGDGVVGALREMLTVARALRTPVEISHLKAIGRQNWNRAVPEMLRLIADARREGLDVTCDVYPYTAGSTQLIHVLPPEVQSGGTAALTARLGDPSVRREIRRRMESGTDFENITHLVGFENVRATGFRLAEDAALEGKSVAEIAVLEEKDPYDALFDLLERERCAPSMIDFIAAEEDIAAILRAPFSSVISDAIYPAAGLLHPRVYGMTAHLLEEYTRKQGVLTLPEAVNRLTRRPADRLRLTGKGRIAVGADADLCLFDPEAVHEMATYANPAQYVAGMDWVFVNGIPAVREGKLTKAKSGKLLKRAD